MSETQKYLKIKEKQLVLIDFDEIMSSVEPDCINDLDSYGLVKDYFIDLSKSDVKKVLYHHLIHSICEEIKNNKDKSIKVIVVPPKITEEHEIAQFCDLEKLNKVIFVLMNKLKAYLPFVIHQSDEFIFEKGLGEAKLDELTCILTQKAHDLENKTFTFEKMKKFARKFELTFLSKEYFNCIKTRLLLR